jgi:hypothetical protein
MKDEKKISRVIAEGEVTGHAHRVCELAEVVEEDGVKIVKAPNGTTVTHEEHGPKILAPGEYRTGIAQEYDPMAEEVREVRD